MPATTITSGPRTGSGASSRVTASTAIQTTSASIVSALTKAASTSARAYPYDALRDAGRRATACAIKATSRPAASVAMCPASEISASDPASQPPIASTTPKPAVSASATQSVPIAVDASAWACPCRWSCPPCPWSLS